MIAVSYNVRLNTAEPIWSTSLKLLLSALYRGSKQTPGVYDQGLEAYVYFGPHQNATGRTSLGQIIFFEKVIVIAGNSPKIQAPTTQVDTLLTGQSPSKQHLSLHGCGDSGGFTTSDFFPPPPTLTKAIAQDPSPLSQQSRDREIPETFQSLLLVFTRCLISCGLAKWPYLTPWPSQELNRGETSWGQKEQHQGWCLNPRIQKPRNTSDSQTYESTNPHLG